MSGTLSERQLRDMTRADRDLPAALRHPAICEVNTAHGGGRWAYQITFKLRSLPLGYASKIRDEWVIRSAGVVERPAGGLRGLLGATKPALSILVTADRDPEFLAGGAT